MSSSLSRRIAAFDHQPDTHSDEDEGPETSNIEAEYVERTQQEQNTDTDQYISTGRNAGLRLGLRYWLIGSGIRVGNDIGAQILGISLCFG